MSLTVRDATPADAPLIAWVQQEASRSGTPLGFWDLAFPGPDEGRLQLVADIATSERAHFAHVDGFLVAELDGEAVGALSGYAPAKKKLGHFVGAMNVVLERQGWSEAHRRLLGHRVAAALLEAVLARGRREGFREAQITYLEGNTPARRAYERAGFVALDGKRDPVFEAVFGAPGTVRMTMPLRRPGDE